MVPIYVEVILQEAVASMAATLTVEARGNTRCLDTSPQRERMRRSFRGLLNVVEVMEDIIQGGAQL